MIARITIAIIIVAASALAVILPRVNLSDYLPIAKANQLETTISKEQASPQRSTAFTEAPVISARSAVILDFKTGSMLYGKNPHLRHLPASTTKLMTAIAALEKCAPHDKLTVKRVETIGSQMGLSQGDEITAENLLYGLLINSGNDSAFALAENCGDSYENFIAEMNNKAQELDMNETHFVNPAGFDNELQYSTSMDLAKLARVATANPLIAKIVKTKSTVVTDTTGLKTYYLENVNKLLGVVDGLEGVKTGETDGSLEILITKTVRGENGIIVSVLGSKDRFGESKSLIEWAFANYVWPK
ncbi:MAG: D-alanyl-D-alanine carboxypeptidase family protein [Patescibacteria group bacterium]